jgi:glycosyltransferase involved in cell wall biosynthesis
VLNQPKLSIKQVIKLNILIVSGFYYPYNNGGPSNTSYWMAKALGAQGYNVKVVALHHNDSVPADEWIDTSYGSVIYVSYRNVNLAFKYVTLAIKQVAEADIIHLNSLFAPTSFLIGLATILKRKRIFWSPRGELSRHALQYTSARKKLQLKILKQFKSRIHFHATAEQENRDIQLLFGNTVTIATIPNLIELHSPVERNPLPYFLFLGRIHPIKGLSNLIASLGDSNLFSQSSFTLKIAGFENRYSAELQRQLEAMGLTDKVAFIGHFDGDRKSELYANAYYLVLPSDSENFGNVVVESLAQGTPVIASTGTPWESLTLRNAGYWVDNSVESLKEVIDLTLALPGAEYEAQRINARQLVEEQFDIRHGINKWIEEYNRVNA